MARHTEAMSAGAAPSWTRSATRHHGPRSRARSVLWRAGLLSASLIMVAAIGGMTYLASLPGVGDAETRVARAMAAHHEPAGMPAPARVVAAAVSVEDEHFYDNVAVNVLSGMGRAALAAAQGGGDTGGSTIDQQLAKQIYGGSTVRDIGLGVKLAVTYTPRQIMRMYLNVAYYGHGYWGLAQAAAGYFGTPPARLSWGEAAMLGGLLQAPSAYDPFEHPVLARARERHVISQLVVNHYLTPREASIALAAPPRTRRG
jgi:membrane peptidoglycan carboxypeptidase